MLARVQTQAWPAPTPAAAASPILQVLDAAAKSFTFPMLDNGYVYLAATRLSLHRSVADWALVIEIFGFSPRAGLPDLSVWTFASRIHGQMARVEFVDDRAYRTYLGAHPNDASAFFHPVEPGHWQDPEEPEALNPAATSVRVRDRTMSLPSPAEYRPAGVEFIEADGPRTADLARYLAAVTRSEVLATPEERRTNVPPGLEEILVLDEWNHPDLVNGELPSSTETFQQLARALEGGDVEAYRPTSRPNTHWSNWPDGGTL